MTGINPEKCALLIVDIQDAFRAAISDFPQIASRIATAVSGFSILERPILVTEQYPNGLGRTAEEVIFTLPDEQVFIEKSTFSACGEPSFVEELEKSGCRDIVLCGVETHVCIAQTALDLIESGYRVFLLSDAVASRFSADRDAALLRLYSAGVVPASVESVFFELMRTSKHPRFKDIQNLIK